MRDVSRCQCPITKQPLVLESKTLLKSADGTTSYTIKDGVANFLSTRLWRTPNNDELERLLEKAKAENYKAALDAVSKDTRYVTDVSRALYLSLLPLDKNKDALEIGASLGQHTKLIAPAVKYLEALEVIPEQALFAQLTCLQEGLTNVSVSAGGDNCLLPYKDAAFDVVITNYVLEWSAGRSGRPPKEGHDLLINECHRVLKQGGTLFLSTKNRYDLRLLTGAIDDHVGFRFGNALPRWLMKIMMKIKPYSLSPGYLHSFGALRRIISKTGFRSITAKLALPDARYPLAYSGFSDAELSELRRDSRLLSADRLTRLLLTKFPTRMIKWIAPSLVFIAEK